jgi:hypothetical protein
VLVLRIVGDPRFSSGRSPRRAGMTIEVRSEMELFIHAGKDAPLKRVGVDPDARVDTVVAAHGVEGGALWREGAEEALDQAETLTGAGVVDGERLYAGRCKRVEVTVHFSDEEPKRHELSPSTTIASLLEWAVGPKGFDLPASERPKHALAICDTDDQADRTAHVGEFANEKCEACFDLVPKEKFEG